VWAPAAVRRAKISFALRAERFGPKFSTCAGKRDTRIGKMKRGDYDAIVLATGGHGQSGPERANINEGACRD